MKKERERQEIKDPIEAARVIVAHGPNIAYISRHSSQYVRDVMAALLKIIEEKQQ